MRIVAIDASTRRGVVSASVETTARAAEAAGAEVERLRLADFEVLTCTSCGICRGNGVCKIADDLPFIAHLVHDADAVIIGTSGLSGPDAAPTRALIERLGGYFAPTRRLGDAQDRRVRRAVIITSVRAPEPVAAFFGQATGQISQLRTALGSAHIRTVGTLAMGADWFGRVRCRRRDRDQAVTLGRVLAGKV